MVAWSEGSSAAMREAIVLASKALGVGSMSAQSVSKGVWWWGKGIGTRERFMVGDAEGHDGSGGWGDGR